MTKSKDALKSVDEEILGKIPKECLKVSIAVDGRLFEVDLKADMLLGSRRNDPFAVAEAIDLQTAQVISWGVALTLVEESVAFLKEGLGVIEAEIMNFIRAALREELSCQVTQAMETDAFKEKYVYFYLQGAGVIPDVKEMKARCAREMKPSDYKRTLKEYLKIRWKLDEEKKKHRLVGLVCDSWKSRSYGLSKLGDIVTSMIDHGILYLPKGVSYDRENRKFETVEVEDSQGSWGPPSRRKEEA